IMKTSSAARALLKQLEVADDRGRRWKLLFAERRPPVIRELLQVAIHGRRRRLLLELANLHDVGVERFWRLWGQWFSRVQIPDDELLRSRDELRQAWNPETPSRTKQQIIDRWALYDPPGLAAVRYRTWVPVFAARLVVADLESFHAQLVE